MLCKSILLVLIVGTYKHYLLALINFKRFEWFLSEKLKLSNIVIQLQYK